MPEKIKLQIEEIRKSGSVNMLDTNGVMEQANSRGFYNLVCFVYENKKAYFSYILTGE